MKKAIFLAAGLALVACSQQPEQVAGQVVEELEDFIAPDLQKDSCQVFRFKPKGQNQYKYFSKCKGVLDSIN